jgi:putative acetyltransferase
MLIRKFRVGDEADLFGIFFSAIHGIASRDYTTAQIDAWAPRSVDPNQWAIKMREIGPFVVEQDGRPIAYADLQPTGYIDQFFVSSSFARQGVGSMLMRRIHGAAASKGISVLTSYVSRTAQPFFRHFGFVIVEEREPVIGGIVVPNASMRKALKLIPGSSRRGR